MSKDLRKYTRGPWKLNTIKGNDVLGPYEYSRIEDIAGRPLVDEYRSELKRSKEKRMRLSEYRGNVKLAVAAPKLVRELAKVLLDFYGYVRQVRKPGYVFSEMQYDCGDQFNIIVEALDCKPEDLTLEALRIIAEEDE
jgi:hypothetical protein